MILIGLVLIIILVLIVLIVLYTSYKILYEKLVSIHLKIESINKIVINLNDKHYNDSLFYTTKLKEIDSGLQGINRSISVIRNIVEVKYNKYNKANTGNKVKSNAYKRNKDNNKANKDN